MFGKKRRADVSADVSAAAAPAADAAAREAARGETRGTTAAGDRKLLIAGNWKMNTTYKGAVTLAQQVSDLARGSWRDRADVVMCPPFTALRGVSNVLNFDRSFIATGAQDCSAHPQGARTGQVSVDMLTDLDVRYCIVGHSERRSELGEDDALVASKARALEEAGVTPIVCVGEDLSCYEAGGTLDRVVSQVAGSLAGLTGEAGLAVAYEPVWAIGTGKVASPEHAQSVARAVREKVAGMLGERAASQLRVLYGGSVRPGNVAAFVGCADIDGVLVGGASLDADDFCAIVENAVEAR